MRVAVLGAGVIGVTSAYYLSQAGHDVTVVDQADSIASGASAQNGGQLSYSYTDALASPSLLKKLPGIILGRDPALRVNPPLDMHWLRWSLGFLRQCTPGAHRDNTASVQQLALKSQALMDDLIAHTGINFDHCTAGKLVLLDSQKGYREAEKSSAAKRALGCKVDVINWQEAERIEPALAAMTRTYQGAIYARSDAVGDSQKFSRALGRWLEEHTKTRFFLGTRIRNITQNPQGTRLIETDQQVLEADNIIVCLGPGGQHLVAGQNNGSVIYPARGYSVTLPPGEAANKVSITDLSTKLVFSRLGECIRIAGFVDFVGYSAEDDAQRVNELVDAARRLAPRLADYKTPEMRAWGGFRPMTTNSRPVVHKDASSGIAYNMGHGMLGWTLACATGHQVTRLL